MALNSVEDLEVILSLASISAEYNAKGFTHMAASLSFVEYRELFM